MFGALASMQTTTIDFLAWVHSLPDSLRKPLAPDQAYLEETSDLYQFVIDSRLLWRVWMIDEWGRFWIAVNRMSADRKPEFHPMVIDDDTFVKIECDTYEIEDERGNANTERASTATKQ